MLYNIIYLRIFMTFFISYNHVICDSDMYHTSVTLYFPSINRENKIKN